jgi:hypothetical protein
MNPGLGYFQKLNMKLLRQLAKELRVSASYLSQVNSGKKKASARVLTKIKAILTRKKLRPPGAAV